MPNSFEKEVQQKLDELWLLPTAPVWKKVEMEIGKDRKKRRGLFWLFFAAVLLAVGWWAATRLNDKRAIIVASPAAKSVAPSTGDATLSTQKISSPPATQKLSADRSTGHPASIITTNGAVKKSTSLPKKEMVVTATTQPSYQKPVAPQMVLQKRTATSLITPKTNEPANVNEASFLVPINKNTPPVKDTPGNVAITAAADSGIVTARPPADSTVKYSDTTGKPAAVDSTVKKKIAQLKWRKEMSLSAGESSYAYGSLFSPSLRASNDIFFAGGGGGPAAQLPVPPAPVTGGLAFSVGYHLAKKISPALELSVGVAYSYYSSQTRVGSKRTNDTVINASMDKALVNEVYTNTGSNPYTNRFHVIEAPVTITFKPAARVPLSVAVGLGYGYLFATNALSYSSSSNLYYKDASNYNRHQLPLSASVSYRVINRKRFGLSAGPLVRYQLLKLESYTGDNNAHLLFGGIKTAISF